MRKKSAQLTKRVPDKRVVRKKKFLKFFQRGQIALYLLLVVVILGAYFMVSGGPTFNLSQDGNNPAGQVVPQTPGAGRNDLQLQPLKFQACGSTTAVDFLVDTSGSMRDNGKLDNIKKALMSFVATLGDKSVIGLRRFSALPNTCYSDVTSRLVPIDFYSNNKTVFAQQVNSLCADGGTNTSTAFSAELKDLTNAVQNQAYKDTPLSLIFISDGIPEGDTSDIPQGLTPSQCAAFSSSIHPVCAYYSPLGVCRCFDSSQDPTSNPSIAQQIRALKNINGKNVHVFSILVYDPNTDAPFKTNLDRMMTAIASTPADYYQTSDPTTIKSIYAQIANKICASNGGPNPTP